MGLPRVGTKCVAVVGLAWMTACQVSPSPGARHFTDALGHACSQNFVASIPYQCPEQGLGTAPSCSATPPMPDGGCTGGAPCWVLDTIANPIADGGAADAAGETTLLADGGAGSVEALCPACCSSAGSPLTEDTNGCAAIPCSAVADCPFENCCVNGWCQ